MDSFRPDLTKKKSLLQEYDLSYSINVVNDKMAEIELLNLASPTISL